MDIGIFRRNKRVFLAWTLSPILLVIIVQLGSIAYCMRINWRLSQNRDMLETINSLSSTIHKSSEALESAIAKTRKVPKTTHEVSRWVNDIASLSDFWIETLSVDKSNGTTPQSNLQGIKPATQAPAGSEVDPPSIIVTMKGHGKYLSVVRFVRDIESGSPLIHFQDVEMTEDPTGKTDAYRCNLVFRIYIIKG